MSNRLADLDPIMYTKALNAYNAMNASKELKEKGVSKVIISETLRPLATQMAYYSRGRMSISDVKKMYKAAGLYDIPDSEAKTPNTWTLDSMHIKGLAIDLVPCKDAKAWWNAPLDVWELMGKIGKSYGLEWGGDWEQKDYPHFQMKLEKVTQKNMEA